METIRNYVENVFADFPQNPRVLQLKREMLQGMEEKYNELRQYGKSEHEAIAGVIADFGSMDEIAQELGLNTEKIDDTNSIRLTQSEAEEYLTQNRKSGRWIGIGVWIILAGVSGLIMFGGEIIAIGPAVFSIGGNFNALSSIFLFSAIAIAVPIFIVNGMRLNAYEDYAKKNIILDTTTRKEIENQNKLYNSRFAIKISVGVGSILVGVAIVTAFAAIGGYYQAPPAFLLFAIGFGVFNFVTAGMTKGSYDVILNQGDYAHKAATFKSEKLIGTISSIYWPVATAIFLAWGFLGNAWHISWVIWPIAGVLFAAVTGIVNAITKNQ
ncbi:MAG: permease prefix domain 1-containing protein [Defluviitaleaceae bacterium]|nr:permease prefix domain 1-containing protein [Defluviitaleaceae bacterium]